MTKKKLIDWPFVVGLLLLPFLVLGVLFVVKFIQNYTRYDQSYFTEEYLARYESPSSVAIALEEALQEADEDLMAELLGTNSGPRDMEPRPSLNYVFLFGRTGDYLQYLYFNRDNYNRHIEFIKEVDGRYVTSAEDMYFYLDSGRWREVAGPLIAMWIVLVIVATSVLYIYRYMARVRESRY